MPSNISARKIHDMLSIILQKGFFMRHVKKGMLLLLALIVILTSPLYSQEAKGLSVSTGADVTSRYIWRGILMNQAPNIQPSITFAAHGLEFGFWGSTTLGNNNAADDAYGISQELDFWMGYTFDLSSDWSLGLVMTDYYFPNAGIKMGNFNNHDDADGPGAHLLEGGLTLSGGPLTLSAYANVYNDAGNCSYFQLDYATQIKETAIQFFIGATPGSKDNPAFYGTDSFNVINLGMTVSRDIVVTEHFTLPVNVSYIVNPRVEQSYLTFGFSL